MKSKLFKSSVFLLLLASVYILPVIWLLFYPQTLHRLVRQILCPGRFSADWEKTTIQAAKEILSNLWKHFVEQVCFVDQTDSGGGD